MNTPRILSYNIHIIWYMYKSLSLSVYIYIYIYILKSYIYIYFIYIYIYIYILSYRIYITWYMYKSLSLYIYIYIYICSSPVDSTDSLDSLFRRPPLSAIVLTRSSGLHPVSLCCEANTGMPMRSSPQENVISEFVFTSSAVLSMSCSSYLDGLWDGR